MIRGKGLTQQSIKHKANEVGGVMELYHKLFEGEKIQFDLTQGQPCFDMRSDFSVGTRSEFKREASTNYQLGERNNYFEN